MGIINLLVKPALVILTLPLTIVTFGLFLLVLNALLFMLVGAIVPGFDVRNFGNALLGALIVSIVTYVANTVFL